MGHKNREIEKKYVLSGSSYSDAIEAVKKNAGKWVNEIEDGSRDFYWGAPNPERANFIRLRYMPGGSGQLTLKHADRDGNFNRIEIDVEIEDPDQTYKFLKQLLGEPIGSIYKDYVVLFLDKEDTTVAVYKVKGDQRVFVEVEARTKARVDQLTKELEKALTVTYEPRSLFQIFMEGKIK